MLRHLNRQNDHVFFGGTKVGIPKLTIEKWERLFETVETLPNTIVSVLAAKNTDDFVATFVVGITMMLDEVVNMVAAVTDLEPEWIKKNADHNELLDFIAKTAKKNDLEAAVKKFRAAFGKWAAKAAGENSAP
ncbi:hypothetical protein [Paenibacillus sp. MBLB4367]|uniref:hypothetical protein n=1 Tax=Paenibacillus sp. MBLB4367 TaxID=3384767 RepID=UPI0039082E43